MQYGDLSWSSVRSSSSPSAGAGLGAGSPRGSHLDGTEELALQQASGPPPSGPAGPTGYQVVERPVDISAEVHLTTVSPLQLSALSGTGPGSTELSPSSEPAEDAIALYYQNENALPPSAATSADSERLESPPPPRKRGRVRYGEQLRPRRRKRPRGRQQQEEDHREHTADDRSSAEPDDDHHHEQLQHQEELADSPEQNDDAARQELVEETSKLLDELRASKAVRRRLRKRPRIMTETGHVLRGLEVKETLQADKWK